MFDELEQLLKLTKMVEATSSNVESTPEEEDVPAEVRTFDDDYSGKYKTLKTQVPPSEVADVPQKPKDGKAYGSSGNATYTDEHGKPVENGPLFEEDGPTVMPESTETNQLAEEAQADDAQADESQAEEAKESAEEAKKSAEVAGDVSQATEQLKNGIEQMTGYDNSSNGTPAENGAPAGTEGGAPSDTQCMTSLGKSLKRGIRGGFRPFGDAVERGMGREFSRKYLCECNSGICQNNPFKLGDVVSASGIPMLFVVKDNDGAMIRTAKPTDCKCDHAVSQDGVWPEFFFDQDELSKVDSASLDQADEIAKFNDRDLDVRGFDGRTIDPGPMELAQDFARSQTMDEIGDALDNILGCYKKAASGDDKEFSYTEVSPTTTYVLPSGEVTTKSMKGGYVCRG